MRCKHRFGADDDVGIGGNVAGLGIDVDHALARQERGELLPAPASHRRARTRSRAAPHAGQIAGRSAFGSHRRSVVARVARKEAETAAAIEHAHGQLVRVAQRLERAVR